MVTNRVHLDTSIDRCADSKLLCALSPALARIRAGLYAGLSGGGAGGAKDGPTDCRFGEVRGVMSKPPGFSPTFGPDEGRRMTGGAPSSSSSTAMGTGGIAGGGAS